MNKWHLSVLIASKVIEKELDEKDQEKLIQEYIKRQEKSNEGYIVAKRMRLLFSN